VNYPSYAAYKPSRVEWLGEIPAHWQLGELRWFARLYAGGTPDTGREEYWDGEIPWINSGAVNQGLITEPSAYISKEGLAGSSAKWIPKAGLVMALAGQGKTKATVAQLGIDATCNQSMAAIVPHNMRGSRFLFWWLTAQYDAIRNLAGGDQRDGLNLEILGTLLVPAVAPEGEAIASFLDRETAKIDTLIAKKRELIDKLNEKRCALISHVVTRGLPPDAARVAGLNPNVPLRPSRIDWLGDIPAHWELAPIGRRLTLQRGVDITREQQEDGEIPVISSGGISSFHNRAFARGPGVLIGRKGSAGSVYYTDTDYWPHDTTLWVREFRRCHARYVFYKLSAMDLTSFDTGSANPTVNRNLVHPVIVSWPPLPEQRDIADYLDRESSKMNVLGAKLEEAIERLREYRYSLVTMAVTGKIDVQGAVGAS
jgi:type I restriction enzyme S subunit